MSLLTKSAIAAALVVAALALGENASAAPLSASLALQDAITPAAQSVQWGGGYYGGYGGYGGFVSNYDCCCPPGYGYYPSTSYGSYASGYYGGFGYTPYYRPYAPRVYRGYWGY